MKNWIKYIVSTIIFFCIFAVFQLIYNRIIDWNMTIISTIIYAIVNTISHIILDKIIK